jgi:hypothetical protein
MPDVTPDELFGRALAQLQEDGTVIIGMLRQVAARIDSLDEQILGLRWMLEGLTQRSNRHDRQYEGLRRRLDEQQEGDKPCP